MEDRHKISFLKKKAGQKKRKRKKQAKERKRCGDRDSKDQPSLNI